ncbi:unnamed protein product, partial [Symbiodinium necroappetens]
VLDAARRHFGLDDLGVDVRRCDAMEVLQKDKQQFDVVIDDIFVGYARSVHKPRWMLQRGLRLAAKHVRP